MPVFETWHNYFACQQLSTTAVDYVHVDLWRTGPSSQHVNEITRRTLYFDFDFCTIDVSIGIYVYTNNDIDENNYHHLHTTEQEQKSE